MAPTASPLSPLTNPLLTPTQLLNFKQQTTEQTTTLNFTQSILTNSAGVLLGLPQDIIGTALVLLQRYQIVSRQPSFDHKTISAAVVYVAAKMSSTPVSPRSVVNVYAYLGSTASVLWVGNPRRRETVSVDVDAEVDARAYYVSEGMYERERQRMFAAEAHVLACLGFDTRVVLPHQLALTYLQALGVTSMELAKRTLEHLNGGLLSPQLLYLTHQPNALAVAAIYLAAREVGVKLVEVNWWEVFDVDREDLGFLVLAFGSLANFAIAEKTRWMESDDAISLVG